MVPPVPGQRPGVVQVRNFPHLDKTVGARNAGVKFNIENDTAPPTLVNNRGQERPPNALAAVLVACVRWCWDRGAEARLAREQGGTWQSVPAYGMPSGARRNIAY